MRLSELVPTAPHKTIFTGWNGFKAPLAITICGLVLFILWLSPPSFLSYSQLSASQIEIFLKSPVALQYPTESSSIIETSPNLNDSNLTKPVLAEFEAAVNEEQQAGFLQNGTAVPPSLVDEVDSSEKSTNNVKPGAVDDESNDQSQPDDDQLQDQILGPPDLPEEKFIFPLLSYQVGTGNQLMEYKSAAVVARTLNRTLCLTPFFSGPGRHFSFLGDRHSGLYVEDRYDTDVLSKFVKVARMDYCLQKCEKKLNEHWRLRHSRPPQWDSWFNDTPRFSADFDRQAPSWSSTEDVAKVLGPRNEVNCVGLGGLFPGLRWKGVYLATSAYLQHSRIVMKAADTFQARAIGLDKYVSVHWRFEESNCRGHPLGLCFSRCTDGAVIANGRPSLKWENMTREVRRQGSKSGFNGVFVSMADVSGAIYGRAVREGVHAVYLSTDGWLRGPESCGILKWVVEDLRKKGLNVAGLWQIPDLPNFVDGTFVHPETITQLFGLEPKEKVSNHMIALVEQEICLRSSVFLGSGQSSWSLAVSDTRRGRQCKINIEETLKESKVALSSTELDRQVIEEILQIKYKPGPTCRDKSKDSISDDDGVDGWLDYESCEVQLDVGGNCTRISA